MRNLYQKIKNMKYRNKLRALLVIASLVPVILIAIYSHIRMSSFVKQREMEDMSSLLEQTRENIDSQIAVYTSLMNYLTYSPDIEEIIREKNMDNYSAYEKYMKVADPLLTVPKSYHDAIRQIQLFADSIKVEHEYTLVPFEKIQEKWWNEELKDEVRIQWMVNRDKKEVAAIRNIYNNRELAAVLCLTLDYDKIFQPFSGIAEDGTRVVAADESGRILYGDRFLGDDYFYAKSSSGENGWDYYLFRSKEAISGEVKQLFLEEIPLILLCAVIVFALGTFFSRIFTRKIEELTRNMDQVNHGSREVTVSSDSEDEVGILVRSFRRMMDEINRLIDEVYVNKIALKEFELKALQAQINPHFLYNVLDTINWMARKKGEDNICHMVTSISSLMRASISNKRSMVYIREEIKYVQDYLYIQETRYGDKFTSYIEVDERLNELEIPKMTIQTLVENAVVHGVENATWDCFLYVSGEITDGMAVFTVKDDGVGMSQEQLEKLMGTEEEPDHEAERTHTHLGVYAVRKRLDYVYQNKARMSITSEPGKGTQVILEIPMNGNVGVTYRKYDETVNENNKKRGDER